MYFTNVEKSCRHCLSCASLGSQFFNFAVLLHQCVLLSSAHAFLEFSTCVHDCVMFILGLWFSCSAVKDVHRGQYEGGRGGRGGSGHGDREREGGLRREGGRGYYGDRDREGGTPREGGSNRQRGTYNNDDRGHSNNYNNSRENDGHWGGRGAYGGGSSGYGDKPFRGEDGEARSLEGSRARGRGGGGRGGYGAEGEERPRRTYDRLSGSGRGYVPLIFILT